MGNHLRLFRCKMKKKYIILQKIIYNSCVCRKIFVILHAKCVHGVMNSIEIKGYKSIKNQTIQLRPINILIGANGSGKSNLLSFFTFVRNLYARNLQAFVSLNGGMDAFLFQGRKVTEQMYAKLDFSTNAYSFTLAAGQDKFIVTEENLWYEHNPYFPNAHNIASFAGESKLQYNTTPRAEYIRQYLRELQKYHFHDTGEKSPFTNVSNIDTGVHFLYPRGENIAAFLYGINKNNAIVYNRIVRTIQSVAPYFHDFLLKPDTEGNIALQWEDKFGVVYGVHDLSDGTIRFIALTTLFLQPQLPQTIIIDEPELGLHPFAIAKLAGMIKSASQRGCQVIAATQSTDLIGHFDPEDILTVDQVNGESVYNRLSAEQLGEWLDDYTLDDLWKRNIITGGQPNND